MNLLYLIFIIFFFIFVIDSGKIRPNFEEIFGDGWNKKEREEKVMIKIEQNERNENSQSASVDQMGEEMGNGPIDQMRNDQNHSKSDQNIIEEPNDQQKREIVNKFDSIKEKLREKIKYKRKDQCKIERKIGKLLGTNRKLIWKWKNELNLNKSKIKKQIYEQKKRKFIERFNEFKELYGQRKQKQFVKELGISKETFIKWKKELMPKYHKSQKHYTNEEKSEKLKKYYEMKERNRKMSDVIMAKKLEISRNTLRNWKKKFATIN